MGWTTLQQAYPWPSARPNIRPHLDGWKVHETVWLDLLSELCSPVLAEIGAWTGKTSCWLLGRFHSLRLVAVDLWTPDAVPYTRAHFDTLVASGRMQPQDQIADLYRINVWDHRDRVVAIQRDSVTGMHAIAAAGVQPDIVYIDAAHDYKHVLDDIDAAIKLFPASVICGDDYSLPNSGVVQAVHEVAGREGRVVEILGNKRFWRYQ